MLDRLLRRLGLDFDFSSDPFSERFSQITDDLYLGVRPTPDDVPTLQAAGITHVVSVLPAGQAEALVFLQADFETLFVALDDEIRQDIAASFAGFFAFADTAQAHDDSKLLVHCAAGVSRSATLVTALLMRRQRLPFLEAFEHVKVRRARALPNIGFASQLQQLEFELLPERGGQSGSLARYLHTYCTVPGDYDDLPPALAQHNYDALKALQSIFGPELPRVIQGTKA